LVSMTTVGKDRGDTGIMIATSVKLFTTRLSTVLQSVQLTSSHECHAE